MTVEVLDYRIKQINHITGINILDDKSFDEALYKLIGMHSNLKKQNNEIRNAAMTEFAERMKKDWMDYDLYLILHSNNLLKPDESIKSYKDMIDEIAREMKAGAE